MVLYNFLQHSLYISDISARFFLVVQFFFSVPSFALVRGQIMSKGERRAGGIE